MTKNGTKPTFVAAVYTTLAAVPHRLGFLYHPAPPWVRGASHAM